jgi:hypothetical protein
MLSVIAVVSLSETVGTSPPERTPIIERRQLRRRLGVRYERRADLLQGLLHLACALICLRFLAPAAA